MTGFNRVTQDFLDWCIGKPTVEVAKQCILHNYIFRIVVEDKDCCIIISW